MGGGEDGDGEGLGGADEFLGGGYSVGRRLAFLVGNRKLEGGETCIFGNSHIAGRKFSWRSQILCRVYGSVNIPLFYGVGKLYKSTGFSVYAF